MLQFERPAKFRTQACFKAMENGSIGTNAAAAHAPVPPQLFLPATGFQ